MQNLEMIDRYFRGECSPEEIARFEQRILGDPAFADEVAFYVSAMEQAQKEKLQKKEAFRELYQQHKNNQEKRRPVLKRLWPYMAAAAVIAGLVIGWFLFLRPPSSEQLATRYIDQHWTQLGVGMGIDKTNMDAARQLYNDGKYDSSLHLLEYIMTADTTRESALRPEAEKLAGIVSLRLPDYDKALIYFKKLENHRLFSNPAVFYQGLTLLKRNLPGDAEQAKLLLQRVVKENLDEKETAAEWLEKL